MYSVYPYKETGEALYIWIQLPLGGCTVGPSEQSGTTEGEVGILNTSQSADPEDRHMEVLEKKSN